jgi:hypothetical protein
LEQREGRLRIDTYPSTAVLVSAATSGWSVVKKTIRPSGVVASNDWK